MTVESVTDPGAPPGGCFQQHQPLGYQWVQGQRPLAYLPLVAVVVVPCSTRQHGLELVDDAVAVEFVVAVEFAVAVEVAVAVVVEFAVAVEFGVVVEFAVVVAAALPSWLYGPFGSS